MFTDSGSSPSMVEENNWLFSQFVNFFDANEIFVNVSYEFEADEYVTLHGRPTNDQLGIRTNTSSYTPLLGTAETSRLLQTQSDVTIDKTLSFVRPQPKTTGFYLGIQDQGVSGRISRLILYYRVARARTDGLLSCPDVPLAQVGAAPFRSECACASNSEPPAGVSLEVSCGADGSCSSGQSCACLPGYELDTNSCTGTHVGNLGTGVL